MDEGKAVAIRRGVQTVGKLAKAVRRFLWLF
jgi:hypothetical protein